VLIDCLAVGDVCRDGDGGEDLVAVALPLGDRGRLRRYRGDKDDGEQSGPASNSCDRVASIVRRRGRVLSTMRWSTPFQRFGGGTAIAMRSTTSVLPATPGGLKRQKEHKESRSSWSSLLRQP